MAEAITLYEVELLKAVRENSISKLQELLSFHYKFNECRYFDYYLLIKALDRKKIDLAKLLIEKSFRVYKNFKSDKEETVLHAAVKSKDEDLITTLMMKGASLDILTPDKKDKTPFHLAIDKNLSFTVELFLSYFDVKTLDEKYFLHYAIKRNKTRIVSLLIEKGLSVMLKSRKKLTPFCIALKNKNLKMMDCLLSRYIMLDIGSKNSNDEDPVNIVSHCGNLEFIKKYFDSGLPINIITNMNTNTWPHFDKNSRSTFLHFAVINNNLEAVKFLLSIGADIIIQNKNESSPLHIAFEAKEIGLWKTWKDFDDNKSIIDLLLKANTKLKSNPINIHGLSHFHIACSQDEPTVVQHFLKHGALINQPVNSECILHKNFAPLHFAAKFRCKKIMEVLLKNGADVKQRDYKKMTALHIAAEESCLETVSLLLQYGADIASVDSHGNTALHLAFENKNYGIMDLLLSVPNAAFSNPIDSKGVSHFHIACTRNNVKVVKSFVEKRVCLDICVPTKSHVDKTTNVSDWAGYSPLHFAVSHNSAEIVQLLLEWGANVGIKDTRGLTPLHIACKHSYEMFDEYIEIILCDLNKQGKVIQQQQSLTEVGKVDKKYVNFSGSIEKVDWSSNRKDHLKIMNSLLNYGSDVNSLDNNGNAPVFHAYAVANEIKNMIENNRHCSQALWTQILEALSEELYVRRKLIINHLLERDVNLEKCFTNGSILHYICCADEECDEIAELFLKKGANVDAKGEIWSPLLRAVTFEKKRLISLLLDHGANVNCIDPANNSTPLLIASKSPSLLSSGIVDLLIEKGANVHARQSNGRTAFHNLASLCTDETPASFSMQQLCPFDAVAQAVFTLIEAGADVDSRDSKGLTPLHVACERCNYDVASLLLQHGADVNVEDNNGRSVCYYSYGRHLENLSSGGCNSLPSNMIMTMDVLRTHIVKMNVIGLSVSKKVSSANFDFEPVTDREKIELIDECQAEMKVLKDTKINDECTLYGVMFKNENSLSHLAKNPTFQAIAKSESLEDKYRQYGYLVKLKYRMGVDRAKLLPAAKCALNNLAVLPETCSENICKYFANAELKESMEALLRLCNSEKTNSNKRQWATWRRNKRQKVE